MTLALTFCARHHTTILSIVYSTQNWADTHWADFSKNPYTTPEVLAINLTTLLSSSRCALVRLREGQDGCGAGINRSL